VEFEGKRGVWDLLSTRRACKVGFDVFVEMECSFSIAPEESFGEVAGVFLTKKHYQTLAAEASDAGSVFGAY